MPSKTVPAQQLSELSEDLVRLAAAKDAEIAALTKERNRAEKSREEWARQYWTETAAYKSEIAALTEQRDRAMLTLRSLDAVLDFSDDDPGSVWHFEDTTAVKSAFAEARAALDAEAAADSALTAC